ncbi:MAG TPA: LysM domain-containing protein [Actinomycetota bacterium]|jgi:LysM repeat protein
MDDGRTEQFEPYQPETSYDWDYEDEPPKGGAPKILWGRVVAILAVLLLAFFLGRATAGSGGISQDRFDELQDENTQLEQQLNQALAQQQNDDATQSPPPDDATESPAPDGNGDSEIYVVKPGDTLRGIAEKFYGDASLDDVIADANGIDDPTQISVGQELIIPPEPD